MSYISNPLLRRMSQDTSASTPLPNPLNSRLRADTQTLLNGFTIPPDSIEPPSPEQAISDYNPARLQRGLAYASSRLQRKITPITQAFHEKLKIAYKDALEDGSDANLGAVRALDGLLHSKAFLNRTLSKEQQDTIKELQKFREMQFFGNYGDYIAETVTELRRQVTKHEPPNFEKLSGRQKWTEIADKLHFEIDNNMDPKQGVLVALYKICDIAVFDFDHMVWAIDNAPERNKSFHCNVKVYIERHQWANLAKQIHVDLKDLASAIPVTRQGDMLKWQKAMEDMKEMYFGQVADDDDPTTWIPKNRAAELDAVALGKTHAKAEIEVKHQQRKAESARRK